LTVIINISDNNTTVWKELKKTKYKPVLSRAQFKTTLSARLKTTDIS